MVIYPFIPSNLEKRKKKKNHEYVSVGVSREGGIIYRDEHMGVGYDALFPASLSPHHIFGCGVSVC
jgi:hypothetical protein